MYDSITVHIFKANNYTRNKEFGLLLSKALFLVMMVSQITTSHQVSDQIDIFKVDERIKHIDQESDYKKLE